MRVPKPWFRASKNAWYVERDGKQVRLAVGRENERAAFEAFYKLMAGTAQPGTHEVPTLVVTVFDLFLEFSCRHLSAAVYSQYCGYLQDFCRTNGRLTVSQLKPFHVSRWLDSHPTWKGSRRHAIEAVKRSFSWAEGEGLVAINPVRHIKKPRGNRRERVATASERAQILGAVKDDAFRDFLTALQETGCRPSEVARVTAADCDLAAGVWVFKRHKTDRKTARPRIVYLTPTMVELSRRLIEINPTGPLFRNTRGKAFTKNSIVCRFRRLRAKFPQLEGVVAYCYRHAYATDALVKGVGVAQVAELLGHSSTEMMRHYSHLADNVAHLREAAVRATQG